jgi:large subunit ribosomal protein L7/L12
MDKVKTLPKTKEEKIKLLQEQLAERERKTAEYSAKLQARIKLIAARGSSDDRKNNTRRKILLGAMLQNRIEKRKISQAKTDEWMSQFLERNEDRTLFGLAPIDKTTSEEGNDSDLDISDKTASYEIDNDDSRIIDITIDNEYPQPPDSFDAPRQY